MGFLGISLPAEKGGVGGTFLDEAVVLEEQVLNYLKYSTRSAKNNIGKTNIQDNIT